MKSQLWWHGPDFLCQGPKDWPNFSVSTTEETPETLKEIVMDQVLGAHASTENVECAVDVRKITSLRKLVDTVAWMFRFCDKVRKQETEAGPLSIAEVQEAKIFLLIEDQKNNFGNVLSEKAKPTIVM